MWAYLTQQDTGFGKQNTFDSELLLIKTELSLVCIAIFFWS